MFYWLQNRFKNSNLTQDSWVTWFTYLHKYVNHITHEQAYWWSDHGVLQISETELLNCFQSNENSCYELKFSLKESSLWPFTCWKSIHKKMKQLFSLYKRLIGKVKQFETYGDLECNSLRNPSLKGQNHTARSKKFYVQLFDIRKTTCSS